MASAILKDAIDRFVSVARAKARTEPDGPYQHHGVGSVDDLQESFARLPGENLFSGQEPGPQAFSGEVCWLRFGKTLFLHRRTDQPCVLEHTGDPDCLMVFALLQGETTVAIGDTVVATRRPGDITFQLDQSPKLRLSMAANSQSFGLFFPIPEGLSFSRSEDAATARRNDLHYRNGFISSGSSNLWSAHLAYALDYAMTAVGAGSGHQADDHILQEYLFLVYRDELSRRAQSRDDSGAYVMVPTKLRVAERYVAANVAKALTVEEVAAQADLSPRDLHTLFTSFRGVTPIGYMKEQRLLGARAALRDATPGADVADVASHWGYAKVTAFTAAYKKRFGELPSDTLGRGA